MTEPDGIGEFVASRSPRLLRSAWLLTGNWHSAEDLVQSALAKAWPRWSTIGDPEAYVRRTMLTTYLSWRRRRAWGEVPVAEFHDGAGGGVDGPPPELRLEVLRALAGLSHQQRAVVVLRYFDDLTESQTAELLGCSLGTVKSHASRALAHLRSAPSLAGILHEEVV